MPFIKRHRAGDQMPRLIHSEPDDRAVPLCEDLVRHTAVQAVILGGSRYSGGWDEQSDLDIMVILQELGDSAGLAKAAAMAVADLKERFYPGYRDWKSPDHGVERGEWIVSMEYYLKHRRTVNHPMAQAARQGRIFSSISEDIEKYRHDGDTSNEWELVTLGKLRRAAFEHRHVPVVREFFDGQRLSRLEVRQTQGTTAYWLLWCSGSAVMSMLGIMYPNRSLVAMAETLKERDPDWSHEFASDLDCLDQYNGCGCEVVVANPIADLEAMWDALERDRVALWRRIEELSGHDLNAAPESGRRGTAAV